MKKKQAEKLVKLFVEKLEQGVNPWSVSWEDAGTGIPINAVTKKKYRGLNHCNLSLYGRFFFESDDPRFCTYRQAKSKGWQVRKGSTGVPITYYSVYEKLNEDTEELETRNVMRFSTVFHASQIDEIPEFETKSYDHVWEPHHAAETAIANLDAKITESETVANPYYRLATDEIVMVSKNRFPDSRDYYAGLFHELGHWTGHESRLNRFASASIGLLDRAKEELVAEICSYVVAQNLGVGTVLDSNASYVASWAKSIKDQPSYLFKACTAAQKAADFILAAMDQSEVKEAA